MEGPSNEKNEVGCPVRRVEVANLCCDWQDRKGAAPGMENRKEIESEKKEVRKKR